MVAVPLLLSACGGTGDNDHVFSVMTLNSGDNDLPEPTMTEVVSAIRHHGIPDILFVQDTPWLVKIKDLAKQLGIPYHLSGRDFTRNQIEIGIISRYPLSHPEFLKLVPRTEDNEAALCVNSIIANNEVLLCTLHLHSQSGDLKRLKSNGKNKYVNLAQFIKREMFDDTVRTNDVEQMLKWKKIVEADKVIIGGDFNSFQFSKPVRMMSSKYEDAFWPSWNYFYGTYKKLSFLIKPKISYIFHSEGFNHIENSIFTETPGDHYQVKATLGIVDQRNK